MGAPDSGKGDLGIRLKRSDKAAAGEADLDLLLSLPWLEPPAGAGATLVSDCF